MKYCSNCGTEIKSAGKFCSNCGHNLQADKENSESKVVETDTKTAVVKEAKQTKNGFSSFSIIATALIVALVTIYLVLESSKKTPKHSANTEAAGSNNGPATAMGQPAVLMQELQEAKAALEKDPNNYDLNVKMGNANFDISRFEQSIVYYKNAIKVKADEPNVLIDLGVSFFNTNEPDSAKKYMDMALKINPKHLQGLFNVGVVHFNSGDSAKAIAYWEKLITLGAESPQAQRAQQFLNQLKTNL